MKKSSDNGLISKTIWTIKNEGLSSLARKANNYLKVKKFTNTYSIAKDYLFINGCTLPHPARYRVEHQMEQLEACGYTCDEVFYEELDIEKLKFYRGFIFFRCPVTENIEKFIEKAHYFNKVCFFDIDDLVINKKYTNQIPYVAALKGDEKKLYDDGVIRMEKTLKLCDYLITSTPTLANELEKTYGKEVLVNRNVASEIMLKLSNIALEKKISYENKTIIGYLSGSITHNPDFELIKPALLKVMEEFPTVYLEVMGYLDLPPEFEPFQTRIIKKKFADWKKLPEVIAELDINLAPLEQSIFNNAKSENKWTEAALVETLTIASNTGAFKEIVKDYKTGLLASSNEEWYEKIKFAITHPEESAEIAKAARKAVIKNHITTYTGIPLSNYLESHLAKNIGFVLPTTNTSGGVNVIVKHCDILRLHGYDVSAISMAKQSDNIQSFSGEVNVLSSVDSKIEQKFDTLVASLWSTVKYVKEFPNVKKRLYLVQNYETNFSKPGERARLEANATYNSFTEIKYITISKWCKKWLKESYGKTATYAPNGIDLNKFIFKSRSFAGKIKILIEGNSLDYYKNVDESFRIVERLDMDKFEIHYLSYEGEPKAWYHVDEFHHKIPANEVHKIYASCDILIKSSILESFSYPPLEMMATGGFAVVAPNDGNIEYLSDGYNCLLYDQGDIDAAVEKINRLVEDAELRKHLEVGARATATSRGWDQLENEILKLYE